MNCFPDPRQAVLDSLCAPAGTGTVTGVSPGGVVSSTVTGGPRFSVDRESVVFLKERSGIRQRLYAVSHPLPGGQSYLGIVGVVQDDNGSWSVNGSGGGSGGGPPRDRPWVNFAGWWNANTFCAGGPVIGEGAERAHRVQLVFADGSTVVDDVGSGLVLFVVEHGVDLPADPEIFSASGELLESHPVFDFYRPPRGGIAAP